MQDIEAGMKADYVLLNHMTQSIYKECNEMIQVYESVYECMSTPCSESFCRDIVWKCL